MTLLVVLLGGLRSLGGGGCAVVALTSEMLQNVLFALFTGIRGGVGDWFGFFIIEDLASRGVHGVCIIRFTHDTL